MTPSLQGTLELLVLHTLSPGPLHGYAIAQQIGKLSEDVLRSSRARSTPRWNVCNVAVG